MKLTALVDNLCCKTPLLAEWGYAVHLETPHGNLLLDTAGSGHILLHNMALLGIAPEKITDICLSHGHFDHSSGLGDVLSKTPRAGIWASGRVHVERRSGKPPMPQRINGGGPWLRPAGLRPIGEKTAIFPDVIAFCVPQEARDPAWICRGDLWEMDEDGVPRPDSFADDVSLLVQGAHGPSLLLGCAHAGLPNILQYVRDRLGVTALYAVIGGTHLSIVPEDRLPAWIARLGDFPVQKWRPCHCTGFKAAAALARAFADTDWCGAGYVMEL